MGLCGPGMEITQNGKFLRIRSRRLQDPVREPHCPAAGRLHRLPGHARVQGHDGQLPAGRIRLQHAEVGDDPRRPLGRDAESLAAAPAGAVAERGDEWQCLDEGARPSAMVMNISPQ